MARGAALPAWAGGAGASKVFSGKTNIILKVLMVADRHVQSPLGLMKLRLEWEHTNKYSEKIPTYCRWNATSLRFEQGKEGETGKP